MRVSRLKTILFLSSFLLTIFSIPITVRADDNDDADDYDVKARVIRISILDGDVSVKHNDSKDWEAAKLNYPLVEGDTVSTGANSNLEIQVDARNFIRLSGNSVLRIITLRDEGIAISAVEGTVIVRLANFDRSKRGYFEIDAPKSTLAAEKNGLYRIDIPKNGRVRLTVREGGSARIYSDTSGFALRDGRAAELVVEGENAGDWDLMAAGPPDAIDSWVAERERYLAQRSKYDVKYYDEHVWGGEDLDAYGDWFKTDDYGWVWRPFPSSISVYSDWAPYRYGQWAWCPPYGWTWIGYEPWGWAPYHYGRWVYYNGYWAWCPRSQFYRNRSWWRPALVAFVFDISFGDNVCWYPLSYHQRDPHSRRYRHDDRRDRDRRPDYGRGRDSDRRHRDGYDNWRGVTRLPRREFGNPERRGQGVDDTVARRVVDTDPERGDMPRRGGWGRVPTVHVPDRPTGAGERTPGVALDDDLRRNRVFRGREPRPNQPEQPNTATPASNTSTETQPSGAVARPEPRRRSEPRTEPPSGNPEDRRAGGRPEGPRRREGSDNTSGAGSGQQATENAPRNEQPATTTPVTPPEPPRETPPVERREREAPVARPDSGNESRPRFEPRSEPRSEPRESRPETRSESPRSEPRRESPRTESPRSESPRSETPRSEPRHESPRSESPRSESPRSESPRSEPSRSESPRSESPRSESPRSAPETSHPKPDKPML